MIAVEENTMLTLKPIEYEQNHLALVQNSKDIDLSMLYVNALMKAENLTEALSVSNAIDTNVKTPKNVWLQRIAIYKQQKNQAQVLTTVESWIQANPYHIEPVLMIADHYVKQRQAETALQYLDKALLNHHKDNLTLKIVKIQLLLDNGKVYEATALYKDPQFVSIKPALKSGIEGRIKLLEKDFASAADKLAPFYKAYPSSQNAILLSLAYRNNNQEGKAEAFLKQHLNNYAKDDRVRMILANSYVATDHAKAIVEYEQLVTSQSKNIVVLNNLAWLTMDKGQLDKALKYSEMAYAIAPKHPSIVDTYGMALFKSGKKAEAWKHLSEAFKLSNGQDISIAMNYAEVLIANKRNNDALAVLNKLKPNSSATIKRLNELKVLAQ